MFDKHFLKSDRAKDIKDGDTLISGEFTKRSEKHIIVIALCLTQDL